MGFTHHVFVGWQKSDLPRQNDGELRVLRQALSRPASFAHAVIRDDGFPECLLELSFSNRMIGRVVLENAGNTSQLFPVETNDRKFVVEFNQVDAPVVLAIIKLSGLEPAEPSQDILFLRSRPFQYQGLLPVAV